MLLSFSSGIFLNLKFEVSTQLLGKIVLHRGNKILFFVFFGVGLTCVFSTAGSQDNHWLYSLASDGGR